MKKNIACCGLDCEQCDAYLATVHNDDALREKTARLWSELNQAPISPADIHCLGCRTEGAKTVFCSLYCAVRKCAMGKELPTCASCPERGSCQTLLAITGNNPQALENLKTLSEA